MKAINIKDEFSKLNENWKPQQIALVDDMQIVIVKMKGETDAWFLHEEEDKYVQIIKGSLKIQFKEESKIVNEGEIIIIPKGKAYSPKAKEEVHVLVFEKSILHD